MKTILSLTLLLAACGRADEGRDRATLDRVVAALNERPQPIQLFTPDADGRSVVEELRKGKRLTYRVRSRETDLSRPDHLAIIISHEPLGEATMELHGKNSSASVEILNPHISSRSIRFVTADVVLADGASTYKDDSGATETTPLLFIMRKEGDGWRIASLRMLAPLWSTYRNRPEPQIPARFSVGRDSHRKEPKRL